VASIALRLAHVVIADSRGFSAAAAAMVAERRPIFMNKASLPQIGYIEGNEAFDLSG